MGEGKEATDRRERVPIGFPLKYSRCDELLKALHKERIFSCNILHRSCKEHIGHWSNSLTPSFSVSYSIIALIHDYQT